MKKGLSMGLISLLSLGLAVGATAQTENMKEAPTWDKGAMAKKSRLQKGTIFFGGNVNFGDAQGNNDYLIANVDLFGVDNKSINFSFVGGYCLTPLMSVGARGTYTYTKNQQTLEADFLNMAFNANQYRTQTLKTGFEIHGFMRNYIPLGNAGQFYLFSETSLYYLNRHNYQRATRNPGMNDESISTILDQSQGVGVGVSMGITYFMAKRLGFELQLGTTGLEIQWKEIVKDRVEEGFARKVNFRNGLNILNIQMGITYYFNLNQ